MPLRTAQLIDLQRTQEELKTLLKHTWGIISVTGHLDKAGAPFFQVRLNPQLHSTTPPNIPSSLKGHPVRTLMGPPQPGELI